MPNTRPAPITQKQVAAFLKPRPKDSHKGLFGTVTVIGGAGGMVGAALLAGRAALKMGAGSVHVGMLADNAPGGGCDPAGTDAALGRRCAETIPSPSIPLPAGEGSR